MSLPPRKIHCPLTVSAVDSKGKGRVGSVAVQPANQPDNCQCKESHNDFHHFVQLLPSTCISWWCVVVKSWTVVGTVVMVLCCCHFFSVWMISVCWNICFPLRMQISLAGCKVTKKHGYTPCTSVFLLFHGNIHTVIFTVVSRAGYVKSLMSGWFPIPLQPVLLCITRTCPLVLTSLCIEIIGNGQWDGAGIGVAVLIHSGAIASEPPPLPHGIEDVVCRKGKYEAFVAEWLA